MDNRACHALEIGELVGAFVRTINKNNQECHASSTSFKLAQYKSFSPTINMQKIYAHTLTHTHRHTTHSHTHAHAYIQAVIVPAFIFFLFTVFPPLRIAPDVTLLQPLTVDFTSVKQGKELGVGAFATVYEAVYIP